MHGAAWDGMGLHGPCACAAAFCAVYRLHLCTCALVLTNQAYCHAPQVLSFDYGAAAARIREGPMGDGLGARVWAIAHAFCRELAAHPETVKGQDVLEIGAGTGLVGIVAAKLGAARVVSGGRVARGGVRHQERGGCSVSSDECWAARWIGCNRS